jgi:mannan endo-1,4-beta-mannosidase
MLHMHKILLLLLFNIAVFQGLIAQTLPIDPKATPETKNLYLNLQRLAKKGIMFGHQDDLAYGIGWKYEPGRSDVKEVVGEYPAVVGWDLGHLELKRPVNLDSVPFDAMRNFAQQVYARGGINTFSWHPNNPVDPSKDTWFQQDSTIKQVFADPAIMARYDAWLDEVAAFFKSLKGPKGEAIPVIFRPLHEHTGSWFWWGRGHSTVAEYTKFWRYTVDYLRNKKGVHNVLYAYSPDRFESREAYLERYPGDEYVDILGFDIYHRPNPSDSIDHFVANTRQMVQTLAEIGKEKNKVITLSETGLEQLPVADWWTRTLVPVVQDAGLSYVLVWRNGRPDHFYAPYPGQASAEDFKKFYQLPNVFFQKDVAAENIYKKPTKSKKGSKL